MTTQANNDASDSDSVRTVLEDAHHLDPSAADAAARDLVSPGTRKPASDDVDTERARRARAETPGGPSDAAPTAADDVDLTPPIDPHDPKLANVDESVERAGW